MNGHENTEFVPGFICRQHRKGVREGVLQGSVLISDISGFTGLTESLFALKKKGAERLSEILNGLFTGMIAAVHSRGGFVASFAGDAFTAVFPGDDGSTAMDAAAGISGLVPVGEKTHLTGITSGIGTGNIQWNIFGSGPFAYLFAGEAVVGAARGEIAVAGGAKARVRPAPPPSRAGWGETGKLFVHRDFMAESHAPEFRDVASVFTGFQGIGDMDGFIDTLMGKAEDYGGYFNLLDCGDKGRIALTIFGAPLSCGKNARRSINFAMELRERYGERIRSGITYGRVFAGFIGSRGVRGHYTVIGDKVNTAARLMETCPPGDIRISGEMGRSVGHLFSLERFPGPPARGALRAPSCFSVTGRAPSPETLRFRGGFFGRKGDLEAILNFAEGTLSRNRTGLFLVSGEAGMGKTRLLWEASRLIEDTSFIYLKCDEILAKSLNPLETFFEEVFRTSGLEDRKTSEAAFEDRFAGLTSAPGYHCSRVKRLKHVIKGFMGIGESPEYTALDGRSRLDNTILAFVHLAGVIAGGRRPLVVVDDFQWADRDTLFALRDIFTQMEADHPLIALLYRPSRRPRPEEAVPTVSPGLSIELSPMEGADQSELLESSLPLPPSDALSRLIRERAEGNPFFMEQMLNYLIDRGLLDCTGNRAELTSRGVELPGSILEVIISRVDALEEEIRQTVKRASVLGRTFNARVLSGMLSGIPIDSHLLSASEAGLWSRLSELQYIFSHGLIREAVYGMQMEGQLARLHLLAGEIIEDLYGDDPRMFADLSYHYEKSGRTGAMLEYTLKAAAYAADNYRNREAVEMYRKYIAHGQDPDMVREARLNLADVFGLMADWQEAIALYDEILASLNTLPSKRLLGRTLSRKGFIRHRIGENAGALECLSEARDIFAELDDDQGLSGVMNNIGTVYIDLNSYEEAISVLTSALSLAGGSGAEEEEMFICCNLGLVYQRMNHLEEAANYFRRSIRTAERLNRRKNIAMLNYGNVKYMQNRVDEAEAIYREAMETAVEMGDRHVARVLMNNIAAIHSARGEFVEALEMLTGALDLARSMNDRKGLRLLNQSIGEIKSFLGDYEGSGEYFARAVETAEELGDERGLGTALGKTGLMLMMKGDTRGAVDRLREAVRFSSQADDLQSVWEHRFALARILRERNDPAPLAELAANMEAIPRERVIPASLWQLPVVRMWVEEASGNHDKALDIAREIAGDYPGTEGEALAWLTSYGMTGDKACGKKALRAYKAVHEENPLAYFRDIMDSLD